MDAPNLELYATEDIGGRLGRGLRIYRSDDTIYEARTTVGGAIARLYEEDGTWHAKVRLPRTDSEEAYDRMQDMMDDINDAYGTALDTNPKQFGDGISHDGAITLQDGDTTLRYVEEEEADTEEKVVANASRASVIKGWLAGTAASIGGGAGTGALAGGAVGMLAGPPGAVGGAIAGAQLGAGAGGALSAWESFDTTLVAGSGSLPSDAPITGRAIRYFDARERRRYQPEAIDASEQHFEHVNTLRTLEEELEQRTRFDQTLHDRLEELRDLEIEAIHDTVMQEHFHEFEDHEGLTATHEADTYADAAAFAGTVLNLVPPTVEPSLYAAPDAFQTLFDQLTYTENGEEHYLDDAATLVHNVYDTPDTDQAIVDWLENEHAALVQEVGREHAMDG